MRPESVAKSEKSRSGVLTATTSMAAGVNLVRSWNPNTDIHFAYKCLYIHTCAFPYIYICIYICTHTHMHIYVAVFASIHIQYTLCVVLRIPY